ncbi:GRIP domain and EKC/KEOPS complex, subunit Pcc1 family-containing protein [Strongyloides ratti]|uniref:GRIP domain and EKC/KEOPS complex, subunit Pcc1 family-containing protein n=1 Tax=Strongyloides ratti TaxID=34506 RepID=A0A090LLQ6_STRRB|nr:GRIP domain and EKC/KEOPS complex, subunit Pcc1 family-containing protein [Strongyloides ratti]CEF68490.1 GRIP domain and EKC/KEOPS complex, subunit Pcc1 family-containing protein [Strongyloides ratti]
MGDQKITMPSDVEMIKEYDNKNYENDKINENNNVNYDKLHTLECRLNIENENDAKILFTTLNVDKEPSRSKTIRHLKLEGKYIVGKFSSVDEKSLQKSIQHFMEMYLLAKSTINIFKTIMFKGLKSKLEDEAKKLSTAVSQYGENMAHQLRTGEGTGGLLNFNKVNNESDNSKSTNTKGNNKKNGDNTTIAQEFDETSLFSLSPIDDTLRTRRLSNCSNTSTNSNTDIFSFENLIPQKSAILTELESNADESVIGSSTFASASKEQISSILNKLNSRSAKYKMKYKNLIATYNELVTENAKCQSVLEQTQDATVKKIKKLKNEKLELEEKLRNIQSGAIPSDAEKIKKLEELLEKCKDNIFMNKTKIANLSKENDELKKKLNEGRENIDNNKDGTSNQLNCKDYNETIKKLEEENAITLATVKAQFHSQLEEKDNEINSWRNKYSQQIFDNENIKKENENLVKLSESLEQEKKEMLEQIVETKKQVLESVEKDERYKREQCEIEFNERLASSLKNNDSKWEEKFVLLKEEYEQKINNLQEGIDNCSTNFVDKNCFDKEYQRVLDELKAENSSLKNEILDLKMLSEKEISDLKKSIKFSSERHNSEIDGIIKEAEEGNNDLKRELENMKCKYNDLTKNVEEERNKLCEKIRLLELESINNNDTITELRKLSDTQKSDLSTELNKLKVQLKTITEERNNLLTRIKDYDKNLKDLKEKYQSEVDENQSLNSKLEEIIIEQSTFKEVTKNEIEELKMLIESKKQEIVNLLNEKETFEAELTDARLVKKLKSQLESDLEDMRNELKETSENLTQSELRYNEMLNKLKEENNILKTEKDLWMKNENYDVDNENNIKELNEKIILADREINNLRDEINKLEEDSEKKQLKQELNEIKENLQQSLNEKNDLSQQLIALQDEFQKLLEKDTENEMATKVNSLEDEKSNLENELESAKNEIDMLNDNIKSLKNIELNDLQKFNAKFEQKDNEIKELSQKLETYDLSKNDYNTLTKEMEELKLSNDNLREEYMQKENLVSELREELNIVKNDRENLDKEIQALLKCKQEHLVDIESSKSKVAELMEEIEKLKDMEIGHKEHINILQEEISRKNEEQEKIVNEKDSLTSEIESLKRQVKENEIALSVTEKYKKEMDKFKKEAEMKVEEMRQKVSQVESDRCSKYQVELEKLKATLENKLEDIDNLKAKKMEVEDLLKEANEKVNNYSAKVVDLEEKLKDNKDLTLKLLEKEDVILELRDQCTKLEQDYVEFKEKSAITISTLETKITEMEQSKASDVKKAMAKVDGDQKRMIKELQKEVKQLYHELSKTSSTNDALNEEIKKLKQIENLSEDCVKNVTTSNLNSEIGGKDDNKTTKRSFDVIDYEELNVLREKVLNYQAKLFELEEKYLKETTALKEEIKKNNLTRSVENNTLANALEIKSINHSINKLSNQFTSAENYTFAEPTEAEYLRNILYRYMYERETLGKGNVTLAKVIGTVAKFSPEQMEAVLNKEEARHLSWIQVAENSSSSAVKSLMGPNVTCVTQRKRSSYDKM